ncbi:hypothetical protein P4S72_14930 [Vibrio sp. PP-XX7]
MNLSGLYGHTLHLNINDVYGQIDCCGIVGAPIHIVVSAACGARAPDTFQA